MNISNETELVRSIVEHRSHRALSLVYFQYATRLRTLAARYLENPNFAEDILQEAMLKLWTLTPEQRLPNKLLPWLQTLVKRRAIDRNRYEKRRSTSVEPEFRPPEAETPEDALTTRQIQTNLQKQIGTLSHQSLRVIKLFYFKDWDCRKIAQAENCPVGTIKSRLHSARGNIKQALQGRSSSEFMSPADGVV